LLVVLDALSVVSVTLVVSTVVGILLEVIQELCELDDVGDGFFSVSDFFAILDFELL
jgi:hypothetical protein